MESSGLASKVYSHLQEELLSGNLVAGAVVSEKQVADRLGISRTPVGEAVRKLASEGFVEQVPRYGTIVKEITKQDIADIYEVREAIEPYAARKAVDTISKTQLDQLEILCNAFEQMANALDKSGGGELEGELLRRFLAADMAFHMMIVRAAANSRIFKVVADSRVVSQVFRIRRRSHDSTIVHGALDYHKKILLALRARDGQAAFDWMFKHINQSKHETLAFFEQSNKVPESPSFDSLGLPSDIVKQLEDAIGENKPQLPPNEK